MKTPKHVLYYMLKEYGLINERGEPKTIDILIGSHFVFEYDTDSYYGAIAGTVLGCELYYATVGGAEIKGIRLTISLTTILDIYGQSHNIKSVDFLKKQKPKLSIFPGNPVEGEFSFTGPFA